MVRLPIFFATFMLLAGCVTTTTHLTTGRALEPGQVQVTGSYTFPIHTNLIAESLETAEAIEDLYDSNDETMTEEEVRDLLDTAMNWALFSSLGALEIGARVGLSKKPLEGLDLGVRYNGAALKGDLLWQLLESRNKRWSLSVNFGYAYQFDITSSAISAVTLTEWSRHDLDAALVIGYAQDDWFRAYFVPRVLYSLVAADPKFSDSMLDNLPDSIRDNYLPSQYFQDENLFYYGGTIGMMLGYRYLFANLELTVMRLEFEPSVLDEPRDYSGVLIAPTAGLTLVFN